MFDFPDAITGDNEPDYWPTPQLCEECKAAHLIDYDECELCLCTRCQQKIESGSQS